MNRKMMAILVFLFISIWTVATAAEKDQKVKRIDSLIAVFDLETQDLDKKITRPITDSIRRELVKSGKWEVIDRNNMDKILVEQKFQLSGCMSGQCIVEVGQMLGVGKIITGSLSMMGKTYYLSLSLVNVETGKIEDVSEDKCKCEVDDLIDASKRLVKRLLGEKVDDFARQSTLTSPVKSESENALSGVFVENFQKRIKQGGGLFTASVEIDVKGVRVTQIAENSPSRWTLEEDDLIAEINRKPIENVEAFLNLSGQIKRGEEVILLIYRGNSERYIRLGTTSKRKK